MLGTNSMSSGFIPKAVSDFISDAADLTRSAAQAATGSQEADEDSRDGAGVQGDPLQAEELEAAQDTLMASHVKDMLVIYERRPGELEPEPEDDKVRHYGPFQRKCWQLLKSGRFDAFFSMLIAVDAILIATAVDLPEESPFLYGLMGINTAAFVFELLIRVAAEPWNIADPLLVFDAIVTLIAVLELVNRLITAPLHILFVRCLRIFRLMRIMRMTKHARQLLPLQLLMDAIHRSVQPLVIVLLLSGILVFAFSVMMTNMVPEAIEDGDDVRHVVLEQYGSVGKSMRTFMEVIDGSGSCSIDGMLTLYRAAQDGRTGSATILVARLLASFVLFLALSGLVTGVFIEQLCGATNRVEEKAHQQELLKSHECLTMIDQVFASMGYSCDDPITWRDIERGLESNLAVQERLDITIEDARRLFLHLDDDGDGSVGTDEFIFGVFKLKTISKSLDMLSIDYQQEKALQRLSDLHSTLRLSIAGIQSRLASFEALLPDVQKNISSVTDGIDEVQKLEEDLMVAHKTRQEASKEGSKDAASTALSIEMLRSNYQLNGRLSAMEEEFVRLQRAEERGVPSVEEQRQVVDGIADSIAESIKRALEQELTALRTGEPSDAGALVSGCVGAGSDDLWTL